MEIRIGDRLWVLRPPGEKIEEVIVENIILTVENDKMGAWVCLSCDDKENVIIVGVFMLQLWLEWAK